jgi:hypothetical protein
METIDPDSTRPAGPLARRGLLLVVAVVLGAALGGACSDDDGGDLAETESIDSTATDDAADAGSGSGDDGGGDSGDEGGDADSAAGSGEILGTSQASMRASVIDDRSTPLRLDVTRLERVDELVELTMVLTNEAAPPTDDSEPQDFTADVVFSGGNYGVNSRYDASGIGLVDDAAQRMYLPAYDSEDVCLCTANLNNESVPPGGTMTITATFGGVPEDLDEVDIRIPQFPTISGLEIR